VKTCTLCGQPKPLEEFHRNHLTRDGRNPRCKDCACAVARQWAKDHRERRYQLNDEWNARNPSNRKERNRRSKLKRKRLLDGAERERFNRRDIYERDGWICQICFEPIDAELAYPHPLSPSLDHIKPISKGGADTRDNTQASHFRCNNLKRDH